MTEVLGEAVLDLTVDADPARRGLAAFEEDVDRTMDEAASDVRELDAAFATLGRNVERQYSRQLISTLTPVRKEIDGTTASFKQLGAGVTDLDHRITLMLGSSVEFRREMANVQRTLLASVAQNAVGIEREYAASRRLTDQWIRYAQVVREARQLPAGPAPFDRAGVERGLPAGAPESRQIPQVSGGTERELVDLLRQRWATGFQHRTDPVVTQEAAYLRSIMRELDPATMERFVRAASGPNWHQMTGGPERGFTRSTDPMRYPPVPYKPGGELVVRDTRLEDEFAKFANYMRTISHPPAGGWGGPAGGGGGDGGGPPIMPTGGGGDGGRGGGGGWWGPAAATAFGRMSGGRFGRGFGMGRFGIPMFGAPFGSLLDLAGFGKERIPMAGLSLAGFGAQGALGGGLLAGGALGQVAVGGGADAAVMKSTIADTKQLYSSYQNLQKAIAVYGAHSRQAAVAQRQLNAQMKDLGPAAGAEMGLAKRVDALNTLWDKATAGARIQAVHILDQVVQLGTAYVPRVAAAAQKNLGIINTGLKPLFAWLEGPQGVGIFNNLERNFARNLPTAVHAFSQGLELLLKIVSAASNRTGGLTKKLDELFTRWNSKPNDQLQQWVDKYIGKFQEWEKLGKALFNVLRDLFKQDAGTGEDIVVTLTKMLDRLDAWEKSTSGSGQLHNLFEIHKKQLHEILDMVPQLAKAFGGFYLALAPLVSKAVLPIISALGHLLTSIESLGKGPTLALGAFFVAWKLGLFSMKDAIMWTGRNILSLLGLSKAQDAAAASAMRNAAAQRAAGAAAATEAAETAPLVAEEGALATGETAAGAGGLLGRFGGLKGVLGKIGPGLAFGAIGAGGGAMLQGPLGLRGGAAATGAGGLVGGLLGSLTPLGPFGTMIGSMIGATLGPTIGHVLGKVFGSGKPYGQQLADGVNKGFGQGFAHSTAGQQLSKSIKQQVDDATHVAQRELNKASLHFQKPTLTNAEKQQIAGDFQRVGQLAANQLQRGWGQYQHQQASVMAGQLTTLLKGLPAQARAAAARSAIAYALGLEQQGKLAKGGAQAMLRQVESVFPELTQYLGTSAKAATANFHNNFKVDKSFQGLQNALNDLRSPQKGLPSVVQAMDSTSGSVIDKANAMASALKDAFGGKWGSLARSNLHELQQVTGSTFDAMLRQTTGNIAAMSDKIRHGNKGAISDAGQQFSRYASAVHGAMKSGSLSAQKGNQLLHDALASTIKTFGSTQSLPAAVSISVGDLTSAAQSALGELLHSPVFAGGGVVQVGRHGHPGRDNVPMNIGGQRFLIGEGEQVAVFNRHQAPIMNRALQREGYAGMAGLFSGVTKPNYMAKGGIAKGSMGLIPPPTVTGDGSPPTMADVVQAYLSEAVDAGNYWLDHSKGGHKRHKALGGLIRLAAGGAVRLSKASPPHQIKGLKSPVGFDDSLIQEINHLEAELQTLAGWQGYIQALHSRVTPTSGERLMQIGQPGTLDENTEMGIDDEFLELYYRERGDARRISAKWPSWLKQAKKFSKQINTLTHEIARIVQLKQGLAPARSATDEAITRRYQTARHNVTIGAATARFNASQLTHDQVSALTNEERLALAKIPPAPPFNFFGDNVQWLTERNQERALTTNEFDQRKAMVQAAQRARNFQGFVSRSNALFELTIQESWEKSAVEAAYNKKRLGYANILSSERARLATDNKWSDALQAAVGPGGFGDTLNSMLDPHGPLAINILTKQNIDIPNLLDEIKAINNGTWQGGAGGGGGTGGSGGSGGSGSGSGSSVNPLLQQQNEELTQALAVSQAQYQVLAGLPQTGPTMLPPAARMPSYLAAARGAFDILANLPKFGGSFALGGIVPGPRGEPRTIIAHGKERITPEGGDPEFHLHISGRDGWLQNMIQVEVAKHERGVATRSRRLLPGRAGSLGG